MISIFRAHLVKEAEPQIKLREITKHLKAYIVWEVCFIEKIDQKFL